MGDNRQSFVYQALGGGSGLFLVYALLYFLASLSICIHRKFRFDIDFIAIINQLTHQFTMDFEATLDHDDNQLMLL